MLRLNKIETGQWTEAWKNTFSICKEPNTDRPEEAIMGFHSQPNCGYWQETWYNNIRGLDEPLNQIEIQKIKNKALKVPT